MGLSGKESCYTDRYDLLTMRKSERILGQRWCRQCLTRYARERRRRKQPEPQPARSVDNRSIEAPAITRSDGPSLEYLASIINGV